jgi:hypothetical protein
MTPLSLKKQSTWEKGIIQGDYSAINNLLD